MSRMPRICLGSVQFGLKYGITNERGQVSAQEIQSILHHASLYGIPWIDTAQAYGDAELSLVSNFLMIMVFAISKLHPQNKKYFNSEDVDIWENAFSASCKRLRVESLDSFLLHSSSDLLKDGGHYLEKWMLDLRDSGRVKRLGVSVYSPSDLQLINQNLWISCSYLSIYDQRFLQDGTLAKLRADGTAIHARSLYLQGLLLSPESKWPSWVDPSVRSHHKALEELALERNCRLIDLVLGFAQEQHDLEAVVIGICNLFELKQLLSVWSTSSPWQSREWTQWALEDINFLDPRNWPST